MEITKRLAVDFTRIFELPAYQQQKYPNARALNGRHADSWKAYSVQEVQQRIDCISTWLLENGYAKGDRALLVPLAGNPQWVLLDLACQQAGLVPVPLHPTLRAEEIEIIITETQPRLCFTANRELAQTYEATVQNRGTSTSVFTVQPGERFFPLLENQQSLTVAQQQRLQESRDAVSENDLLTILYTSGSSGSPKGVMLSHRNVVSNIKAILTLLPLEPSHRVISFLPFSHIFERTTCYAYLAFGVSVYFSEDRDHFAHDFKSARPHFCTCVPRVLEKMHDYMLERQLQRSWLTRTIITWAMNTGKKYGTGTVLKPWLLLKLLAARWLVLGRWRKALGGQIKYMAVGAAALRPEIARLFTAAGIRVIEGYGMTETSPIISMNHVEPGMFRFGTVGLVLPGAEVKLDQPNEQGEGEILVKGPNVMVGYFQKPELTAEVLSGEGWLRTGDVGMWVNHRFLKITDRKKDIFKTSAGKYITPARLEQHFAQSAFINRCLILGFQRPYVTALVVPNFNMLEAWCSQQGVHWTSPPFMVHNIRVRTRMEEEIERLNEEVNAVERIRNFVLCPQDWSVEEGEVTATLKPVRQRLAERYKKEIEAMYK
ncbi:MAG: AMP-dependent synthetase/ligase [Cyclobacteriaceae bacterium]|jgi:long-chain acyl-CoA synthetase|nr:long-chain fatty acid--CoA ligase [Flammeovirgaceae bacterium]